MKLLKPVLLFAGFNASAFAVFLLSGQGAIATCATTPGELDCYLKKRTFWHSKEDKFTRSLVAAVDLSVSTTHGTQGRKSSEDHWTIRFRDGSQLPVTPKGVAWPRGNMSLKALRYLLVDRTSSGPAMQSLVSYGIIPWFLGLLAAAIGWVLLVIGLAKPVQNVSAEVLSDNRRANFFMFVAVTGMAVALWWIIFRALGDFFAG